MIPAAITQTSATGRPKRRNASSSQPNAKNFGIAAITKIAPAAISTRRLTHGDYLRADGRSCGWGRANGYAEGELTSAARIAVMTRAQDTKAVRDRTGGMARR